jgi:DNA end-binding protein Ku
MPARSSWKGYLKLSLVSVPVKAYTATSSSGGISLNQLHEECNSRIRYTKTCPIHGEVPSSEIVSGYEFTKGQYVVIDPSEIDKLRPESDKSINVDHFVSSDTIDPVYFSGKQYYLVPDGPVGQKAFALLREGMAQEGMYGIAQVVIGNREQLVLVRPLEQLLAMNVLEYDTAVKKASAFEDEIVETAASDQELKLTRTLIEAMVSEDFDIAEYKDLYTERLTTLIEAKVEGKELVTPPAEEEPHVINLMDALKASVKRAEKPEQPKKKAVARKKAKPKPKKAASARTRSTATQKKKKSS